ncbi:hypothetical protein D3C86_1878530 [compost metagenome]
MLWCGEDARVDPVQLAADLPQAQQAQWQVPGVQALPALRRGAAPELGSGRVRPVQQAPIGPADASVHQYPEYTNHGNANEHDVEHEQLPCPDHQVTDALAGGQ